MRTTIINIHEEGAWRWLVSMLGAPSAVLMGVCGYMASVHGMMSFRKDRLPELDIPAWASVAWRVTDDDHLCAIVRIGDKAPVSVQSYLHLPEEDRSRLRGPCTTATRSGILAMWPAWQLGVFEPELSNSSCRGFVLSPVGASWF